MSLSRLRFTLGTGLTGTVLALTVGLVAVGAGYLGAHLGEAITDPIRFRLAVLTALCAVPFMVTAIREGPGDGTVSDLFSPLHVMCAAVLTLYAIRGWWIASNHVGGPDVTFRVAEAYQSNMIPALDLTIFGLLAFFAGYAWMVGGVIGRAVPQPTALPADLRFRVGAVALTVGLPAFAFAAVRGQGIAGSVAEPVAALGTLALLGVVFVTASIRTSVGRARAKAKLVLAVVLISLAGFSVASGQKSTILAVVLTAGASYHYWFRRIRITGLLVGGLLFALVAFPVIDTLRWELSATPRRPLLTALTHLPGAIASTQSSTGLPRTQRSLSAYLSDTEHTVISRLIGLDSLMVIHALTPTFYPYLHGSTYNRLPASFVPRALWPSKPPLSLATWFADNYWGRTTAADASTQPVTFAGEMFINFGTLGVVVGMFLIGIGYRAWYSWVSLRKTVVTVGLYVLTIPFLLQIEGDSVLIFRTALDRVVVALAFVVVMVWFSHGRVKHVSLR